MKTDKEILKLMDHLDELVVQEPDEQTIEEVKALRLPLELLKELPFTEVPRTTDTRLNKFIANVEKASVVGKTRNIRSFVIISAIAACLLLLLWLKPFNNNSVMGDYTSLASNPDKLSFVYDLNSKSLSKNDVFDLKLLLAKEQNPNIQIAMIDLLENYTPQFFDSDELLTNLNQSEIPTVQMAMLNALELTDFSNVTEGLHQYKSSKALDETVNNKIEELLNKVETKNTK